MPENVGFVDPAGGLHLVRALWQISSGSLLLSRHTHAMRRISDWLQEHPTLVAIVGPVGAAMGGLGLRSVRGPLGVMVVLILLAICAATPAIALRVNRLQQSRREAEKCLMRLLHTCGVSFGHPGLHVRVNVMRFSPNRLRRKVDSRTAFNMDSDPDRDLEIDAMAGVSGQAASHRRPAFGDISLPLQAGGPDWGLQDDEKARVRPTLNSILSVPVFNPNDNDGPLLATLQVDSDLPMHEIGFDSEPKWRLAERFADVVSLLLQVD